MSELEDKNKGNMGIGDWTQSPIPNPQGKKIIFNNYNI